MQTKKFLNIWLLSINFEKYTPLNLPSRSRKGAFRDAEGRLIGVNFSKLEFSTTGEHEPALQQHDYSMQHFINRRTPAALLQ